MEILIIGGGFMGEAFAKGLMQKGNVPKSDIIIVEVNKERRTELSNQGYTVRENVFEACDSASVILVAIKPQDINHLTNLGNYISQETLLISIGYITGRSGTFIKA